MAGAFRVKIEGLYLEGEHYKRGAILAPTSSIPDYFLELGYVEPVKPGTKAQTGASRKARSTKAASK